MGGEFQQSIKSSGGTAGSSLALLLQRSGFKTLALTIHHHVIESKIRLLLELQFPQLWKWERWARAAVGIKGDSGGEALTQCLHLQGGHTFFDSTALLPLPGNCYIQQSWGK